MVEDSHDEESLEVRLENCVVRLEAIDRQLDASGVMARHKNLSRDALAHWAVRAATARQRTVEEMVLLRHLLHQQTQEKNRAPALRGEILSLRHQIERLKSQEKEALARLQTKEEKIALLEKKNRNLREQLEQQSKGRTRKDSLRFLFESLLSGERAVLEVLVRSENEVVEKYLRDTAYAVPLAFRTQWNAAEHARGVPRARRREHPKQTSTLAHSER
jgi:septal ring factor EnvC (AmiA/AmiB activator)